MRSAKSSRRRTSANPLRRTRKARRNRLAGNLVEQHTSDRWFMQQALALADKALFDATPNPRVGCVIVSDGRIIGSGWTQRYGSAHAEQHALANCADDPAGSTAFVTLEPCNTVGASGRAESC